MVIYPNCFPGLNAFLHKTWQMRETARDISQRRMKSMKNDPFAPHFLERLSTAPRKVAILRTSRIGDFLCAVPALRALRARLPGAEISMIMLPLLSDLARRLPYLDRVWNFPGFPGLADHLFEAHTAVHFLQQMQRENFDLAVQMQGTGVYSNTFTLLLGARWTAGFIRPGDPPGLLDAALPYPHHLHEVHCVLALTDFLGAPATGEELEFPLNELVRRRALSFLSHWPRPWIGLHPAARDPVRCWPLQRYSALAEQLLARQDGTIFLLGDKEASPARFDPSMSTRQMIPVECSRSPLHRYSQLRKRSCKKHACGWYKHDWSVTSIVE